VLIAPVLPGLSDRPEQLEAVATAVVEAGADSVSTVMLHLRPGVREVFFERLRETHPTLVPVLERRYRNRSTLPKADQALVSDIVHGAVRSAGGTSSPPREARHLAGDGVIRQSATAISEPAEEPTQLPLL
jgi:DNA repair photolyase